ncbi:putative leader peptide [Amycolatopsis carbonis]|uniref:putative leader peptide n=1 Tax=Amycolatopsis carbonis TaxID=715471 RepID=UPI00333F9219
MHVDPERPPPQPLQGAFGQSGLGRQLGYVRHDVHCPSHRTGAPRTLLHPGGSSAAERTTPSPEPALTASQQLPETSAPRRKTAGSEHRSPTAAVHTQAPRPGPPTIRTRLNHVLNAWLSGPVSPAGVLLVARRHVDLLRVASALCRPAR